jgi:DNA processing protein
MSNNDLACLLALWRSPNINPVSFVETIYKYGSPQEAVKHHLTQPDWKNVEKDLHWASLPNHHIVTYQMPTYPTLLKEIANPPPLLFVDGDFALLNSMQIAMVGSRHPTSSGEDNAFQFAKCFAAQNLAVTSGLALGIDAACHEGALSGHGKTIAVIGSGPDEIYPKRNHTLAARISQNGAIVTEFPTGVKALPHHFPQRNRIISGLSLGVIVVEAAYGSGSLITARYALEQNREVFAIPGSIHNPLSRGCHHLIKQGAKLVETAEDVLEEFQGRIKLNDTTGPRSRASGEISNTCSARYRSRQSVNSPSNLPTKQTKLINCINYEATAVDLIIARSGLTAEQVSSILLHLELEGHIASVPGGYCRVSIK